MRVNLLPRETRERQRARRQTVGTVAVGVVLVGLLGGFFVLQQMRLNGLRDDIAAQEEVNGRLRAEIAELQQFAELQQELITTRDLLDTLLADEVRWSGVLRDVSLVVPGNVWLETLNGNVLSETAEGTTGATGATTDTTTGAGLIGQMSFTGRGLSHRAAALWLTRLEDVEGFANPWLSSSLKSEIGFTPVVQFTSTVDLSNILLVRAPGVPG